MASMNRITGRSAFLALLKDEGITHLFGNPGTTELPIMHALKDHPDLTYVMGMQESIVVYMADGFSRAGARGASSDVSPVEAEERGRRDEVVRTRTTVGVSSGSASRAARAEGPIRKARPRLAAGRGTPRSPRTLQEAIANTTCTPQALRASRKGRGTSGLAAVERQARDRLVAKPSSVLEQVQAGRPAAR